MYTHFSFMCMQQLSQTLLGNNFRGAVNLTTQKLQACTNVQSTGLGNDFILKN